MWAIARPEHAGGLRRGAWYPVQEDQIDSKIVLLVARQQTPVPRHLLEIRRHQPDRFTVVYLSREDPNPVRGTARDLGYTYAVCPDCSARLRVQTRQEEMDCANCEHHGVVAWWETG